MCLYLCPCFITQLHALCARWYKTFDIPGMFLVLPLVVQLEIMQENGEVVCCVGSSMNLHNIPTFARADVALCLPPSLDCAELVSRTPARAGVIARRSASLFPSPLCGNYARTY